MKNKKLFAILTLVCFMFTLMPVAAFAAPVTYDDDQVYVLEGSEWVEKAEVVTGTVTVGVGDGTAALPDDANHVFYAVDANGKGVAIAAAKEVGSLYLAVAGDYVVKAIDITGVTGETLLKVEGIIADVDTVANKVAKLESWATGLNKVATGAKVAVENPEVTFFVGFVDGITTTSAYDAGSIVANGGWDPLTGEKTVQVKLEVVGGNANMVKDKELTFTPVGYVDLEFEDGKVTDKNGVVEFKLTSKYVGEDYKVIVSYGDAKATLTIDVTSANVANVVVNAEAAAPKNIKTIADTGVEFKFTDKNGTAYTVTDSNLASMTPGQYKISVVSQPADAKLKAADFELKADDKAKEGVADLKVKAASKAKVKEGKYTVRVTLASGAYAEGTFAVAKMGDVASIMMYNAPKTIVYNAAAATPVVGDALMTMDAAGVTGFPAGTVEYSVVGKAVKEFTKADGKLTLVDDADEYIGSTITVYAVYEEAATGKVFTTSNTLTVVDAADAVVFKNTTAEVGVNTALYADVVDAKGNVIKLETTDPAIVSVDVIVLDKPADAVVIATQGGYTNDAGVKVNFLANKAGEYKIQTIVVDEANRYLTTIDTIKVGGGINTFNDVVVVSIGATKMIVNDTVVTLDVAPYIENSRTMMQYNVLGAFGFDIQWVQETRSVVAEGNGIKVVMTIGEKVATVNGEEVTLDVAPQIVNGRTVVPVGFLTGTFGIDNQIIKAADGSVADILFTK